MTKIKYCQEISYLIEETGCQAQKIAKQVLQKFHAWNKNLLRCMVNNALVHLVVQATAVKENKRYKLFVDVLFNEFACMNNNFAIQIV